jgi:hypothetical protein
MGGIDLRISTFLVAARPGRRTSARRDRTWVDSATSSAICWEDNPDVLPAEVDKAARILCVTSNIPLRAARELLVNAVVHANYSQQGAPIRVAIYDDRLEIDNPGRATPNCAIA